MIVLNDCDPISVPLAVTIGKFDGFHLGHQRLLNHILDNKSLHSLVIIIRDPSVDYIFSNDEILSYLSEHNIEYVYWLNLDEKTKNISAEDFVRILCGKYYIRQFVIGEDFHFGKKATGDFHLLNELGTKFGYNVFVSDFVYRDYNRVSSSLIRKHLASGSVKEANFLLGHNYYIKGKVIKGKSLGHLLGYPTANLVKYKLFPANGVYYTKCMINNYAYDSITNIGIRPTFSNDNIVNAETYILDYSGDLYENTILLEFVEYLREEKSFESADLLVEQISKDINVIKNIKK